MALTTLNKSNISSSLSAPLRLCAPFQTYLNLSELKLGYLLNFGTALMKKGIFRCVNALDDSQ